MPSQTLHLPPRTAATATVAVFAAAWHRRWRATWRPRTVETYAQILRTQIVPQLGRVPMAHLDRAHVLAWLETLGTRQLASATIHLALAVLAMLCREAVELGIRETVPTTGLGRRYRHPPATRTIPTADEMRRLLAAAERAAPDGTPIYALAAYAGLRVGEARGIQARDLDLEHGRLWVRRQLHTRGNRVAALKGTGERVIEVAASLRPVLEQLLAGAQPRTPWLCAAPGATYPPSDSALRRGLRRAAMTAGLAPVGLHLLRHFYASTLISRGVSIEFVRRQLGHRDIRLTVATYGCHAPMERPAALDQF